MVSTAADHLVAIVIVGILFMGTVVALPFSTFQTIDQQQLRNTALNVFDAMLLDVGSPSNWGSNFPFDQNLLEKFGLAYSDPFSKFVLDVDKVQKIDVSNPTGFIEYDRVCELLNIQDHGFRLSISRPFVVNASLRILGTEVQYYVAVTRTEDGTPIPNAEVKLTTTVAFIGSDGKTFDVYKLEPETYFTDIRGICEGSQFPVVSGEINHAVSILTVTVAGMSTTVIAQTESPFAGIIKINTSGDTIILSLPEEMIANDTHSERRVHEIDAYVSEELLSLFKSETMSPPEIKITHGSGYEYWSLTFPGLRFLDPTALIFWMETTLKGYGRVMVVLAGSLDYTAEEEILNFGLDHRNVTPIVTMRRLVVISDMTYVVSLSFWRN